MTNPLLLLSVSALAVISLACQQPASDEAATDPSTRTDTTTASQPDVEYEPAYPSEVSSEGLSEGDVAQQETTHSHDDDEHSHEGAEMHSHDDGEAQSHDERSNGLDEDEHDHQH